MKSRDAIVNMRNYERITNIKYYGNYVLMYKGIIASRAIQEVIRVIDGKRAEQQYAKKKIGYRYEFVDAEARNIFNSRVVTPSMIKCTYRFNQFGLRDLMINKNMVEAYYLRCDSVEM